MALALYRKYRPRTFAEIIGQEHVTEPLSQALRSNRLHHAYLFSGPRGCGKTSSARILARSLNCEKGPTPDPCGQCESCRALAPDGPGSIDVIEIDAASHGGVDDARDLRERAFFAPVSSRYKVYVIDEAHMVSPAGFNALLKLVEEPPDYVKFVFATTEPEKVLGTIKSRTHHYPFRLIPAGVLRPYLEQLCVTEGVTVQPTVFPLVVRAGGGSARDCLSVLDQLIAGAGKEGVTYARAVALLGVTDVALLDEICDALAAGDGATAYATIDRVAEAGHDARRFAGDLLERLRDLIVLQQVPDAIDKGLLDGTADDLARMSAQAERFGPATLSRMADIVHTGLIDMRGTTAPRLVLELITARMLLPGADDSTAALLQRMERMERRLTLAGGDAPLATADSAPSSGVPATPPSAPPAPAAPLAPATAARSAVPATRPDAPGAVPSAAAAPPATRPAPGAVDAAAVRRIWDEVLTMVRRKNQRVAAVVREATVRDVDGDVLVLLFKHAFHAQALSTAPELLIEALHEVLGGQWQIRCDVSGQAPAVDVSPAGTSAAPSPDQVAYAPVPDRPSPAASAITTEDDWPALAPLGGEEETAGEDEHPGGSTATADALSKGAVKAAKRPAQRNAGSSSKAGSTAPVAQSPGGSEPDSGNAASALDSSAAHPTGSEAAAPASGAAGDDVPAPPSASGAGSTAQSTGSGTSGSAGGTRSTTRNAGGAGSTPRGAVGGRASTRGAAGKGGSSRGTGRSTSHDDAWAGTGEEPPYDPEVDGPIRGTDGYIGFDPGDEPIDDGGTQIRQTSEEQALDLLRQTLGAVKIDEVDTR